MEALGVTGGSQSVSSLPHSKEEGSLYSLRKEVVCHPPRSKWCLSLQGRISRLPSKEGNHIPPSKEASSVSPSKDESSVLPFKEEGSPPPSEDASSVVHYKEGSCV